MNRISVCFFLLIFLLAACGGGVEDDPTPTTGSIPPVLLQTNNAPFPGSLPPVAGTAVNNPGSVPPFASAPTLPVPGTGGEPIVTLQLITDYSNLTPGTRVNLAGRVEMRQEIGGAQPVGILVDAQGNEVLVMMPPFMLIQMDGQEVELSGIISAPPGEGQRMMLQVSSPESSNAPGFLSQQATLPFAQGQSLPLPGVNATADVPDTIANAQFVPLETGIAPNLTALQTYDALQTTFAQDLTGRVWLSLVGNGTLGWTLEFTTPGANAGVLYQINADGSVLRREVAAPTAGALPIDRTRIVLDSPQVQERIGGEGVMALLSLRAGENGAITWSAIGTDSEPIDATTP